ncbi:MAG: HAD family phosphatase [Nitrososphaerales archaeon]
MNKKLVAFDMDGTLINGRLVFAIGDKYGVSDKIREIMVKNIDGHEKSTEIAQLWKGINASEVTEAVKGISIMDGASEIIQEFKKRDYIIGVISDSYTLATDHIVKKFNMDFNVANVLELKDGLLTGKVNMPLGWEQINCWCKISVCKRFHLERLARSMNIQLRDTIAIGDTRNDLCMIERAGIGIAFNPKDKKIMRNKIVVESQDLRKIMQYF